MKKLLLSTFGLSLGLGAFAQLPVSQTAENRHAILEEFTGINCQYCPDGHAVGNTLSAANPGTFHKIHIHAGSYANTTPDLRTTEGTSIANNSGLGGYPAGGVNRQGTSWGVGRGSWTGLTNTVTALSSHVNVAVEGSVNSSTRLLTVDVEMFYTNLGAASATEYLVVALVQNNIPGGQIDAGNYNPTGWKCQPTVYKHMEVLRDLVNNGGTTGDAITPASGVLTRQYQVTLPAQIAGVDLELGELALVAYLKDNNSMAGSASGSIITGNSGPVAVVGLPAADMSATANHSAPAGLCDNQFTPSVTVTNNSGSSITGIDVSYILNSGTPVTVNLPAQTIAASGTYTHTFPQTTLNTGSNQIDYEVVLTDASVADYSALNNTPCPDFINVMPTTTFGTAHTEGFESMSLGQDEPANSIYVEPTDIRAYVVNQGISTGVTWDIGGFGNSANSYRWDFFAINPNEYSEIIWEKLDFTNGSHQMTFDVAYATYSGGEQDQIEVFVSTDCGQNWTNVFNEAGSTLATHAPVGNNTRYYPSAGAADWVTKVINLSAYDGQSELMIKMRGTSDFGNSAYIDNINISNNVGIDETINKNTVSVYPNPTNDISTVSFNLNESATVGMDVYNAMGSVVFTTGTQTYNSGLQKIAFNGTDLPSGMYFINLSVDGEVITKKVSLLK